MSDLTVKDLIKALLEYPEDMRVYWGIDSEPCWLAKKGMGIEDFPMRVDYISKNRKKPYLYFADFTDIEKIRKEYRHREEKHVWKFWR